MSYIDENDRSERIEKLALLQMRYSTRAKSVAATYVLWFLFGWWGVHRFYLGQTQLGILTIGGYALLVVLAFFTLGLSLIPLGIWWLIELFTLINTVRSINYQIEVELRRRCSTRPPAKRSAKECLSRSKVAMKSARKSCNNKLPTY